MSSWKYQCPVCWLEDTGETSFFDHLFTAHFEPGYRCWCGSPVYGPNTLRNHILEQDATAYDHYHRTMLGVMP